MKRRVLSLAMALLLCVQLIPLGVLAAGETDTGLCAHHTAHDTALCGHAQAEAGAPCAYECAVCPVQALIDALPEAGEITADHAQSVGTELDAIHAEILALMEKTGAGDPSELLNLDRYNAAAAALHTLAGEEGAGEPAPILDVGHEFLDEATGLWFAVNAILSEDVYVTVKRPGNYEKGSYQVPAYVVYEGINCVVTGIATEAFKNCTNLKSIHLDADVRHRYVIYSEAFYGCTSLAQITFPDTLDMIYNNAFEGCTSLKKITLPDNVTDIGNSAFQGCTGLTSITIPGSVTSIGNSAFQGCTGLTSITIPGGITSIGNSAFQGCNGLISITIQDGVTSIGNGAFSGCTGLASITIPSSVTSIGDSAFQNCSNLDNITIPDGVTSIGVAAFRYCTKLTSITIPSSVTTIDGSAFIFCNSLQTVLLMTDSPKTIADDAFSNTPATITHKYVAPTNLHWDGTTLRWDGLGTGYVQYEVKINPIDADSGIRPIAKTVYTTDHFYDFSGYISPGTYMVSVTAVLPEMQDNSQPKYESSETVTLEEQRVPPRIEISNIYPVRAGVDSANISFVANMPGTMYYFVTDLIQQNPSIDTSGEGMAIKEGYNLFHPTLNAAIDPTQWQYVYVTFKTADGVLSEITRIDVVGTSRTTHRLTVTADEGGNIDPGSRYVEDGGSISFTITPDSGYKLDTLTLDGEDVTSAVAGNQYTLSNVTAAHTIQVSFKLDDSVAPLSAPTNLTWDGTTARWDAVDNASGYAVQLYKDDAVCGSAVTTTDTKYAFSFSEEGAYTFRVKALGNGSAYADSPEAVSGTYDHTDTPPLQTGTVTITSDISKTYDGQPVSAPSFTADSKGAVTIEYKPRGTTDDAYTTTAPVKAMDYTLRVTVAADGSYTEASATRDFAIAKAELRDVSAAQDGTLTYNGQPQTPGAETTATAVNNEAVTFRYADTRNGSYGTEIPSFTNAGTYTVYFWAQADNHEDFVGTFDVTIGSALLTNVSAAQDGTLTYNGQPQTPGVETTATAVNNETVTFTYSLEKNGTYTKSVPAFTNAGEYTLYYQATAPGHEGQAGQFTVTVGKKALTVADVTVAEKTYDGTQNAVVTSVIFQGLEGTDQLVFDMDFTVAGFFTDVNAGTDKTVNGQVWLKDTPAANNYVMADGRFTIRNQTITKAENQWVTAPSISGWTYGDAPTAPVAQARFGTAQFSYSPRTRSAEAPTEAGDYVLTVTVPQSDNYTGLTCTLNFTIAKADPAVTWPRDLAAMTGDKLSAVALPQGFRWDDGDLVVRYGEHTYPMTFTPADTDNYNEAQANVRVTGYESFTVTSGANQTVTKGKTAEFTVDIPYQDFRGILVDGAAVSGASYQAAATAGGLTKVTLTDTYLTSLKTGRHTIVFLGGYGQAETEFKLKNPGSPETGDPSNPVLWLAILMTGILGLTVTLVSKKRTGK